MRPPVNSPLVVSQLFGGNPAEAYTSQYSWNKGSVIIGHDGIDIAVPEGTDLYPVFDGTIHLFFQDWGFGTYALLNDNYGRMFLYAHCSSFRVADRARVTIHTPFGHSGSTGNSTGPHLHGGLYLSPYDYQNRYGAACEWISKLDHDVEVNINEV